MFSSCTTGFTAALTDGTMFSSCTIGFTAALTSDGGSCISTTPSGLIAVRDSYAVSKLRDDEVRLPPCGGMYFGLPMRPRGKAGRDRSRSRFRMTASVRYLDSRASPT